MGVRGRVERGQVRERVREGGVALERGPRAQGEAAQAVTQPAQAPRHVRAHDEHGLARGDQRPERPGQALPARIGIPASRSVRGGLRGRPPERRLELNQGPGEISVRLAEHLHRRRGARPRAAQDEPRLDESVPGVALERERRVGRGARLDGQAGEPKATARARAPPPFTVKRTCLPSPIATGSDSSAARSSSATSGLAIPNGARRSSSSARSSPSESPATTASTRSTGTSSSGDNAASACASNAARKASRRPRSTSRPAAARWPPWRARCAAQALRPASRS